MYGVHACATQSLDATGARHPTPHATPAAAPTASMDSGYPASSESGLGTPPPPPPHPTTGRPSRPLWATSACCAVYTRASSARGRFGSAEFESVGGRRAHGYGFADADARGRGADGPHHEHSSAAPHSSAAHPHPPAHESNLVPTGDPPATEYNTSATANSASTNSTSTDTGEDESGSGSASGEGEGDGKADGAWGGKGKGRKGKLFARLKEKMHIGGS
ncbi:hypothetical protein B0H16DRAFT_1618593 [Mycena metata]|uniref:Uncharacterized protein n=1 Tax=Mycena metata TaxID=1033252 RepID=A0AAD7H7S8_9AGAR|nr:hypothetical protein B0H16DRAFT_1618593 [Mycena metata]